jgi:hypothetical protein
VGEEGGRGRKGLVRGEGVKGWVWDKQVSLLHTHSDPHTQTLTHPHPHIHTHSLSLGALVKIPDQIQLVGVHKLGLRAGAPRERHRPLLRFERGQVDAAAVAGGAAAQAPHQLPVSEHEVVGVQRVGLVEDNTGLRLPTKGGGWMRRSGDA